VVIAEREQAIKDANAIAREGRASLYPDALATAQIVAIAVARRRENNATVVLQESIGRTTTCDILTAEIAVISAALEYI
jgi:signal recognition particle GTPase